MPHETLADTWNAETRRPPVMEYQSKVRVQYVGGYTISAIKALRNVTGLSLKSAKCTIEWEGGFLICISVLNTLRNLYEQELKNMGQADYDHWKIMCDPIEL